MRKLAVFATIGLLLFTLIGCANNPKPSTLPPGALNQFDATSYESLMGAQAVLTSVKADIAKLPPEAKPALNKAIASYNVAESAWKAYHSGANGDTAALTAALNQAVADVAALLTSISGAKTSQLHPLPDGYKWVCAPEGDVCHLEELTMRGFA